MIKEIEPLGPTGHLLHKATILRLRVKANLLKEFKLTKKAAKTGRKRNINIIDLQYVEGCAFVMYKYYAVYISDLSILGFWYPLGSWNCHVQILREDRNYSTSVEQPRQL